LRPPAQMVEDSRIKLGDILIDEYNDEIGILVRQYILLDELNVWDVHWTKRNNDINDEKIHHYEEGSLRILISEGTLKHYSST
jgi:hypothetical protein